VSQVVAVARAMRRLGTTSPTAYSALFETRKVSAGALKSTVAAALETATKRTADETAASGSETPKVVRASVAEIGAARDVATGAPAKVTAPTLESIRATLDRVNGSADKGVRGSEDDRTRVLAILATLTETVRTASLV
jgi:hypothetical protein